MVVSGNNGEGIEETKPDDQPLSTPIALEGAENQNTPIAMSIDVPNEYIITDIV